ncbi:hypothetical protein [Psychroserpens sp. SPM9]|uniref:hypothetical protein n=1 Tax=Psychroserpens sp. SPM9 TaxID=2975598 RepID=UPI0021A5F4AC|nr:hypothetical protein [Psychroserpens sp. SPM9]MDG5491973.1 hypothetical protein [Psychroserpens sp. SPM9]
MNIPSNAKKGFQFAIITIVTFLLFLLVQILAANQIISINTYTFASGFIMILVFVSSIIGFIFSIKGRKEPNSFKKLFGIIANTILFFLFVATVIANIMDVFNAFN